MAVPTSVSAEASSNAPVKFVDTRKHRQPVLEKKTEAVSEQSSSKLQARAGGFKISKSLLA